MTNKYEEFKTYLKKIGSGEFTGKSLTREETKSALMLMLKEEASAAQIGGFMIAHRIRRPIPEELAGMIDAYIELGPKIQSPSNQRQPIFFGMPFDGRKKNSTYLSSDNFTITNSETACYFAWWFSYASKIWRYP